MWPDQGGDHVPAPMDDLSLQDESMAIALRALVPTAIRNGFGRAILGHTIVGRVFRRRPPAAPWDNATPVREELFGTERLEQHAESLAAAQPVTATPPKVRSLHSRLNENAAILLDVYRASAAELEAGLDVVPAAEWLLDNYHLIEQHIREIREDLPPGYYR